MEDPLSVFDSDKELDIVLLDDNDAESVSLTLDVADPVCVSERLWDDDNEVLEVWDSLWENDPECVVVTDSLLV